MASGHFKAFLKIHKISSLGRGIVYPMFSKISFITLLALCMVSEGAVYEASQPLGYPMNHYWGGSVAGIPLYERTGSAGYVTRYSTFLRADLKEFVPGQRSISLPVVEFEILNPIPKSLEIKREISFGVFADYTIETRVLPFSVVFQWEESRVLDGYNFDCFNVPTRVSGDSIVVEYSIQGPTENKAGSRIISLPSSCVFNPSSFYRTGSVVVDNYPQQIGLIFPGTFFYFSVELDGEVEVIEVVDGEEIVLDFSQLKLGLTAYDNELTLSDESVSVSTYTQPSTGGSVSGGGTYSPGDDVTIDAIANPGYVFAGWADPFTEEPNPYSFEVVESVVITAQFSPDTADDDGDGLSNYQEVVEYMTDPEESDSDDDGFPDGIEVESNMDPNVPDEALVNFIKANADLFELISEDRMAQLQLDGTLLVLTEQDSPVVRCQLKMLDPNGSWEPVDSPVEWEFSSFDKLLLYIETNLSVSNEGD